jgi:hypothetical protein
VIAGSPLVAALLPAGASAANLRAGVGKADITPQLCRSCRMSRAREPVQAGVTALPGAQREVALAAADEREGRPRGCRAWQSPAVRDVDLTYRPALANCGAVRFKLGKRTRLVKRRSGGVFSVRAPAGRAIKVLSARDRNGNVAPGGLTLSH